MFVRFFALPIQFSPKLGSKIENTTLSLGKDKNKCHKMYFQQIRSKPNLLRWKCHKIAAKSNQEIHLRNILHRKMRIEDIFIFANSVHTSQNSSTIFTCVSVRMSPSVTSPFISTVWCSRPYKPYNFWKLIIWWW